MTNSEDQTYDVIVIGSGLGGLTAGALAAKQGARVLVLERHKIIGGAAHIFGRPKLLVETGLHEMDGLDECDIKKQLFAELGLLDRLEFITVPEFYVVQHPELVKEPFVMPDGIDAAKEALVQRFPQHQKAVTSWFKKLTKIRTKLKILTENSHRRSWWIINGPIFPLRFWQLIRHDRTTVGEHMNKLFGDDEAVKMVLTANAQYYTGDIANMSLLFFAAAQGSYHQGGGHFIKGGSLSLSRSLAQTIKQAGGSVLTRREVRKILIDKRKVAGIVHASTTGTDPIKAYAPLLFGNAAPNVLRDLLPKPQAGQFWKEFETLKPSTSLWSIYLGITEPPSDFGMKHYSSFFYPDWHKKLSDHPRSSELLGFAPTGDMPTYVAVNYQAINSGLADKGQHLVVLCGLDRLRYWEMLEQADYEQKKQSWMEAIVTDFCQKYPGIEAHIAYQEMATARTVHRYMNTPDGAVYGYSQTPKQAGRHRPGPTTRIPGLYLASAFSQPGGGFTGAMLAGQMAWRFAVHKG